MSQRLNHVLIAMDGVPAGILEATGRAYRFSYLNAYKDSAKSLPVSINYPLQEGHWEYAFAGELPPYFGQLLPEGWLRDVAESAHLPMNTPLEKLASLCRENLGAVEIYDCPLAMNAPYAEMQDWITQQKAARKEPILLQAGSLPHKYPKWKHCLWCHEKLPTAGYNANYHDACSLQFFGSEKAPSLLIDSTSLRQIAEDQLRRNESLTGVQPKFSACFQGQHSAIRDLNFIVKPEPKIDRVSEGVSYKSSAVAELAAMHFADLLQLEVAESALLYLQDGQPALISKRFDRLDGGKSHTEDCAQVLMARDKYRGSHEQMANQLKKIEDADEKQRNFSRLLKVILFNFLIGNSDGHLKNYSIFHRLENGVARFDLTPFYDILPIHLFARQDKDQLALTLNGKKRSIAKTDFQSLAVKLGIKVQTIDDFVSEFEANLPDYFETFRMFGVEEELLVIHERYIEEQLALLR